jgi:hypothetical protein
MSDQFNVPPDMENGDWVTPAWLDTYVRGNFKAVWPYTAIGQIAYPIAANELGILSLVPGGLLYAGANAPAWLPKPSAYSRLTHDGTSFSWVAPARCLAFRAVSNFPLTDIAQTAIELNYEVEDENWHSTTANLSRITIPASGRYEAMAYVVIFNNSGSNITSIGVHIKHSNGSFLGGDTKTGFINQAEFSFSFPSYEFSASPGDYIEVVSDRSNISSSEVLVTSAFLQLRRIR